MRVRRLIHLPRVLALLVFMLLAQTAAAGHVDLGDSHAGGEPCALCAAVSVLSAGAVAAAAEVSVVIPSRETGSFHAVLVTSRRYHSGFIRGPPSTP